MVEIVDLASLAERAPIEATLAAWHADEWAHLYEPAVWDAEIALDELRAMGGEGLPRTLVAFDGGELVGSVSLLASDDLPGWAGVGPWLASLFVAPSWRGRGIGGQLVDACLDLAGALGVDDVHLFTRRSPGVVPRPGLAAAQHGRRQRRRRSR